jgi:hypothetical protein
LVAVSVGVIATEENPRLVSIQQLSVVASGGSGRSVSEVLDVKFVGFSVLEDSVVGVFREEVHVVETGTDEVSLTSIARFATRQVNRVSLASGARRVRFEGNSLDLNLSRVGVSVLVDTRSSLIFSPLVEGSFAEEGSSLNRRGGEEEGCEEVRGQHFR